MQIKSALRTHLTAVRMTNSMKTVGSNDSEAVGKDEPCLTASEGESQYGGSLETWR